MTTETAAPATGSHAAILHWPWAVAAAVMAAGVSAWGLAHGRLLLYGDATAHLMIARRMVDSRTPGLSQWGSVWLPFPHLLIAPFTLVMAWWRTGAAGAIVAVASFALATWFLHRLAARHFGAGVAHWAALAFLLNPDLLYLAAVPMTEAVYIMAFVGAVDQISLARCGGTAGRAARATAANRADDSGNIHVLGAGLWALAAAMTRYDGWFCLPFFALALLWPRARGTWHWAWGARFCAVAGIGPLFWFAYNQFYFGDWLNFLRGPYSARAIYLRALRHGGQRYPGDHHLLVAAQYFGKAAQLDCGWGLIILGILGVAVWLWRGAASRDADLGPANGTVRAERWVPALLLLPLPWYVWAVRSGNVPIFVPMYWPHGYYNLRYGVQVLAAAAVFSGVAVAAAAQWRGWGIERGDSRRGAPGARTRFSLPVLFGGRRERGIWTLAGLIVLAGYLAMLGGVGPMTYAEAVHNAPARLAMEHQLAAALGGWRPGETVLMYVGSYPGALPDDSIPLRAVIQESNFRQWDQALEAPQQHAEWVVFQAGSPLARGINRQALRRHFRVVARFTAPLQPAITVYRRQGR
ncbi:MAG: hypothetical protein ACRD2F_05585 [Terriglobales bacterium]